MCTAGTSTTSPANHRVRSCRLLPGCRVPRSIRELLSRLRLNKIGWPFHLRGKLSALFRSEQVSRNRSAAPTVHGSSRLKKDEARRACLVAPLVFRGALLSAYSQLLLSIWLNEFVFFFADDEYWTRRGAHHAFRR